MMCPMDGFPPLWLIWTPYLAKRVVSEIKLAKWVVSAKRVVSEIKLAKRVVSEIKLAKRVLFLRLNWPKGLCF